jgi:hypothetical protein
VHKLVGLIDLGEQLGIDVHRARLIASTTASCLTLISTLPGGKRIICGRCTMPRGHLQYSSMGHDP